MASEVGILNREAEIDQVMRETTLIRPEAALVACRSGEDVSDIVNEDGRPLTAEQRDRLGLGRAILDVVRAETVKEERGERSVLERRGGAPARRRPPPALRTVSARPRGTLAHRT